MARPTVRTNLLSLLFVILILEIPSVVSASDKNEFVSQRKTWWVKRITDDVYTTGRLSFRQIKYLSEVGFQSVISMFRYHQRGMLGDEVLPDSREAMDVTARLSGMQYIELLQFEELAPHQWANRQMVARLDLAMQNVRKPLVVCSKDGFASTLISLLYIASQNRKNASLPNLTSADIVTRGASLGYDFTPVPYRTVIGQIKGDRNKPVLARPDVTITNWSKLWLIKPVIKNWYVAGQIRKNHMGLLKGLGFVSIVNSRKRVTSKLTGEPSQEEVTLLNIRDDLLTKQGRQKIPVLEAHRIDPKKPNEYISRDSKVNFESRNYAEYGDDIGYNETLEHIHVTRNSMDYLSTPLDVDGPFPYTVEEFDKYKVSILKESKKGNVLVHCASGHRAGILVLALAGLEHKKNSTWALQRAHELGYSYTIDAVNVLRSILDNQLQNTALNTGKQTVPFLKPPPGYNSTGDLVMYALAGVILAVVCIAATIILHKLISKRHKSKYSNHRAHMFDDTPPLLRTTDM